MGALSSIIDKINSLLPQSLQRENYSLEGLAQTLNHCAREGLLDRRTFLQIAGLIASTQGLAQLLFPRSAQAQYNMGAFWKQPVATGASSYPANTGSDPYWDYVSLLMNMDTPTPSTGFTAVFADESNVGKAPTVYGSPYIESVSPFSGKSSARFDGTSAAIAFPSSSDYQFDGDFTIEFRWRRNSGTGNKPLFGLSTGGTAFIGLGLDNGNITWSVNVNYDGTCGAYTIGTWYHAALVRQGSTATVYINGVSTASATKSGTLGSSSTVFEIGSRAVNYPDYADCNIADFRVYKGVAKYTAAFTPSITPIGLGTANDKYWGYCVLACPFENTLKDMSGKRATLIGTSSLSTSTKKFGTASGAFMTGNDGVSVPSDNSLVSWSDFTVEAWIYGTSWGSNVSIVAQCSAGWTNVGYFVGVTNLGKLFVCASSNGTSWDIIQNGTGSTTLSLNTWYHVAVTRQGTTIRLFVNGVLDTTFTATTALTFASTAPVYIGGGTPVSTPFYGYIDSLRLTKGYARYTSTFTPPTASYPVGKDETADPFWNYTVLAMHMDNLTDSRGRYTVTNNNSVAVNTSTYRFGSGSTYYNGTGSYLSLPAASDFSIRDFNFTVEAWVNFSGLTGTGAYPAFLMIATQTQLGTSSNSTFAIYYNGGALRVSLFSGSSVLYAMSTPWSSSNLNRWYHVAVVRAGSGFYLFVDGVVMSTYTSAAVIDTSTVPFTIGADGVGAGLFNGYIDDFRMTKGVARYTQNFTPPTRAFATTQYTTGSGSIVTSGLVAHLDAGDVASYTTTGSASNLFLYSQDFTNGAWVKGGSSVSAGVTMAPDGSSTAIKLVEDTSALAQHYTYQGLNGLTAGSQYTVSVYVKIAERSIFQIGTWDGSTAEGAIFDIPSNQIIYGTGTLTNVGGGWYRCSTTRSVAGTTLSAVFYLVSAGQGSEYTGDGTSGLYLWGPQCEQSSAVSTYLPTTSSVVSRSRSQVFSNLVASSADGMPAGSYDFFLGSSVSSESSDPTFVGVAGGKTANDYFSLDGGDYFTLSSAVTTFLNSLHKSGAQFTVEALVYVPGGSRTHIFGTSGYSSNPAGLTLEVTSTNLLSMTAYRSTAFSTFSVSSDSAIAPNQWHHVAVSLTEGATGFLYCDGSYSKVSSSNTFSASYSSPSNGTNATGARIASWTDGLTIAPSGTRIAVLRLYNRALTKAELDQNWNATRARFGL